MSWFKRRPQARASVGTPEGLTATGVYLDLVNGLKDRIAKVERDKAVLLGLVAVLATGLVASLPLRKVVPFFYEVDSSTGRVSASSLVAQELRVSDRNVAYFLRLWVARLVTINAATLREGLPGAYRWTRGPAQAELDTWIERTDRTAQRIGRTPGLTREVIGLPTVSFNEGRTVAFVDFVWVEKVNGTETERKRKLLSIEFGLLSGAERGGVSDDPDNPLGLLITHFTLNDQQVTQ